MEKEKDASLDTWGNRRQFSRVRAQLQMQYRVIRDKGASPAWNSTVTKNISASGVCFESFHPLSLNSMLEVKLSVPFFKTPISLKARVVRAAEIKAGEIYGVAASIIDISQADRKKMQIEIQQIDINGILHQAVVQGATDVHFSLGHPPMLRRAGKLFPLNTEALDKSSLKRMIFSLLDEGQINKFWENLELNTSVTIMTVEGTYRFRVNVHLQQESVEAVFHLIKMPIPAFEDLRLPEIVKSFAYKKSGLVLVAGLAGSGKTTTCASLIDLVNSERSCVITTLQQPIEYIIPAKKSIIKQREIGVDTKSFESGLENILNTDSDVLMIGDLLDHRVIELAIRTALAGKLIFVTVVNSSVVGTLTSIIYSFPAEKQYYIRKILSDSLLGIVCQKLLPLKGNETEQVLATEVLVNNLNVSEIIREGLFDKVSWTMQNDNKSGMCTFERSLKDLADAGLIDD